jgi:uncharacterized protein YabE (DUF348 family)
MTRLSIKPQRFHGYFIAALMLVASFGIISISIKKANAASTEPLGSAEHIINLHDDGNDIGFITKAKNLREAFKTAGVRLDANDRTEPGLDEELVARSYEVNIYRARPVIVRTNGTETRIITAYRTARQIAEQAGLKLQAEDRPVLSPSKDILLDGAAAILTVDYATPFNFEFYSKKMVAYTQAKTVGEMLKEKGITPQAKDEVKPSLDTPITTGMTVQLWRNGEQTVTLDEDVPFETEKIKDTNHDKGYKEVKTAGVNGKRTVTYKIVMKDGKEVSRQTLNSVSTKEMVKQVEIIGTKVSLPAGSHEDWMAAAGLSASDYGYANYIFGKESGWRPNAVSSNGYYGLGQTNYNKLVSACPNWESDPVCQIRLFNGYAVGRYGSWAQAYDFWNSHHWW